MVFFMHQEHYSAPWESGIAPPPHTYLIFLGVYISVVKYVGVVGPPQYGVIA